MQENMPNIAILSPSQDAYSETFIQAHKRKLKGNVYYYYGRLESLSLEGIGNLHSSKKNGFYKLKRKLANKSYTWYHHQFLKDSLNKNKIEVVLAEYGTTAHEYLSIFKDLDLPVVVHFHGFDASVTRIMREKDNYKELFEYARFIVVVSKKMYEDFLKLGCPEAKLVYNVYGPEDSFLAIDARLNKPQFISVGRFVDKKAPYLSILAFEIVHRKFPEAKLLMAGDGYLLNTCKNLVKYHNLENSVEFLGVISPEDFRVYLKESLAFVQHSITAENGDSEGTPVAILEASAAGLPVISTLHAGIPDVIKNKSTGFLVKERDVSGMAKSMMKLLENISLAKQIGEAGRENIKNNFNLQRHINVLDNLIEKCIK
jgi:colanic acid/amylovoran biosynthesis glycosyltransferase